MLDEQTRFFRTKIKLEMEQGASIGRTYPRNTGVNRELISSFKAYAPAEKKALSLDYIREKKSLLIG